MKLDPAQLVIATRNRKKCAEMAALLTPHGILLRSLDDYPAAPHVEETGETFAENAALKASQVARALGCWTLADDSGLEVDALGGAPGVHSARYAGEDGNDAANNEKLLLELQAVPDENRGAAFACHLALADPSGEICLRVEDRCRGRIVHELHGENGFGYDPLFLVLEYHRTFGELGPSLKNVLSHRARAFAKVAPQIAVLLGNQG
jgi:XTP/dITP diphosphohydrolase